MSLSLGHARGQVSVCARAVRKEGGREKKSARACTRADSCVRQDQLQAAWNWLKESMQFDKWDRVKLLMFGADRLSLRTYFDEWVSLVPHLDSQGGSPLQRQASSKQMEELKSQFHAELAEMRSSVLKLQMTVQTKDDEVKELQSQLAQAQELLACVPQKALSAAQKQRVRLGSQATGPAAAGSSGGGLAGGGLAAAGGTRKVKGGHVGFSDDVEEIEVSQEISDGEEDASLQAKIRFVERVVKHWRNQGLGVAFDTWRSFVKSHQQLVRSATKVVGHWLHRTLALAYETWHEHAHAQARMRGILKRIAERWLHRDVAVAFMSWKENADKQKRVEYITGRILRHWTHRTSAAAFDSWHEHAQEQVM